MGHTGLACLCSVHWYCRAGTDCSLLWEEAPASLGGGGCHAPFDESTVKDINNWVDQKTDHMIPGILNEIPENTLMYLINAVTFNAKWQNTYADDDIFHLM